MLGKISRRRRARVVLPLEEQPEKATMRAFSSGMLVVRERCSWKWKCLVKCLVRLITGWKSPKPEIWGWQTLRWPLECNKLSN